MQISSDKSDALRAVHLPGERLGKGLRLLWRLAWDVCRLPVLTLLVILEPIVQFVLCTCAVLMLLSAIVLKSTVHRPDLPFWGMLALSIAEFPA